MKKTPYTIIVTGGSGLLGTALKKVLPEACYPTSKEFDITDLAGMEKYCAKKRIKTILHAAAFTSPPKVDSEPLKALEVNIIGTANVVKLASELNARLIYMCTDYVFKGDKGRYREDDPVFPVNKYAWSKLGGECAVRLYDKSLVIRTSFGPDIFPYDKAFYDQWTSREPVREIARKLALLISNSITGVVHIGGERRSVYYYAKYVSPEKKIQKISVKDMTFAIPIDTSLDTSLYEKIQK